MTTPAIKPAHKAIKTYYEALAAYQRQDVEHETALRSAFQNLLEQCGRQHGWTLIPELSDKAAGKDIRPDGTFRDDFYITRGHWEAKDSHDNLETEIKKKIAKGYPTGNIIFEDTQHAQLYQNGEQAMVVDLTNAQQLADLLNAFFAYTEPAHEDFGKAIDEFKERVPDLARGLVEKINAAHQENPKFIAAFGTFFELCRSSLNPNLSRAAVDEMLVQHLLTERLIRTIFDNQDFTRRNVIAAEVEKVIDALVSKSFNRHEFLKSLDRFYLAIESAAATIESFTEKQHFLNTVYERFFQGYSVKVADTHGIVYTPQEIVDFMCASVAEVLQSEFGKTLGDKDVQILDPCTGTGNFIVNLMRRIPKRDLPRMYRQQLFANEVMLLPYYIAALNIEHGFYELFGQYEQFEGLCFVDTLDLAKGDQSTFGFMAQENIARVERERDAKITVVIGNPPYNANQLNENDNNKNRKYDVVDAQIKMTYAQESIATLKNKLYDPYVKFIRWATDRLNGRDGIVCMVTNNSFFVDGPPFDGMRKLLERDYTSIYLVDLHGNVRRNPKLSGTTHNVFGIQVGVGITLAVRSSRQKRRRIFYHRVPEDWRRERKLAWLAAARSISKVELQRLSLDSRQNWLPQVYASEFSKFIRLGNKDESTFFKRYSTGAKSNRDEIVYGFDRDALCARIETFAERYNREVDRYRRRHKGESIDDFIEYGPIKWSSTLKLHLQRGDYAEIDRTRVRTCLYRPFSKQYLYYDAILNDRPGILRMVFPTPETESENLVICTTSHSQVQFSALIADRIVNEAVGGRAGQCFPFYIYDKNGAKRRENITDWALKHFREHYGNKKLSKWDIFYYVYGLLHHPGYRQRYAENLRRELPRIPLAPDFKAVGAAGEKLARLHLDYEKLQPWPLQWIETPGVPLSCHVEKMRLAKDKQSLKINDSLTLGGVPPAVFEYRLGNRSALEWVIDQYQVSEDKRSGIRSDPNRRDDPEYIVRLVGQVVRVSVETVEIVKGLPAEFARVEQDNFNGSDLQREGSEERG
jgi:predicted helicase